MIKIIRVESCSSCPFYGMCPAWKKLTRQQRVALNLSNAVPYNFILKDCHLDDENATSQNDDKQASKKSKL